MKIICVGRNYVDHIAELANEKPTDPVIFIKPDTALLEKDKNFYLPKFSNDVHHEIELVFRIGKVGKNIDSKFALKYIDSYGIGIDFTARDLQAKLKEKGLPWEKAKAFDGSALVSNLLPFSEDILQQPVLFSLKKNNQLVQSGSSDLMIWKIETLIQEISKFFTLKTGDLIFTGTPAGVSAVKENDFLEGFLGEDKLFELNIL